MTSSNRWKVIVPRAARNLIANPSFELGTTGWAAVGSNSIARSVEESFKGDYSLACTYADSLLMATYAATLTAEAYTLSARVLVPAGWDGGNLLLGINGFAGAVVDVASTASDGVMEEWLYLEVTFTPDAGDLSGNLLLQAGSAPTGGAKVYLDGVQCELAVDSPSAAAVGGLALTGEGIETAVPVNGTWYCDGDQPGCTWDGAPHASQSRRLAGSRAGGQVLDFEADFSFRVRHWPGAGMAPVDNISLERVTLPGAEWQRARLASRTFVLSGTLVGESSGAGNLGERRAALIPVLSPFAYDGGPVTFLFKGREIQARYAGGMELDKVIWRYEELNLPFLATDPRWHRQARPENSEALSTGTVTTRLILAKIGGEWTACGPPAAPGTAVYTSIRDIKAGPDGKIYVCGVFQNFNNVAAADYIARYNPLTDVWEGVGAPSSGATITSILKMAFAPNGDLYVVGDFTNLAGIAAADYIARYTAAGVWEAVGTPSSGATITDVQAVAYGWGNRLWVGGNFTNLAGIAAADYIAYYDISAGSWNAAGSTSGANVEVRDIWAARFIDRVYAIGQFTMIDGVSAQLVAVREIGNWAAMGSGLSHPGNRIYVTGAGIVYAVGEFLQAGQIISERAAFWNGEKWQAMALGVDNTAHALTQLATGEIVVGGEFGSINSVLNNTFVGAFGVAYWNGSIWNPPDFLLPGSSTVYAAEALANGDLYLGYNTTGDATIPAAVTIENEGSAPTWPTFVVSQSGGAPSTLVRIENETTGKKLTFSYSLAPGVTLWIDLRPESLGMYHNAPNAAASRQGLGSGSGTGLVKLASTGSAPGGRFFRFGPDSDLSTFQLVPGENLINLYIEAGSGATVTAYVRWVEAFESVD